MIPTWKNTLQWFSYSPNIEEYRERVLEYEYDFFIWENEIYNTRTCSLVKEYSVGDLKWTTISELLKED